MVNMVMTTTVPVAPTRVEQIWEETQKDPDLQELIEVIIEGWTANEQTKWDQNEAKTAETKNSETKVCEAVFLDTNITRSAFCGHGHTRAGAVRGN